MPKGCQLNPDVIQSTQVLVYEPPFEEDKINKESSITTNLGSSSVKTTKKQPSGHVSPIPEKRTIPNRMHVP